MLFFPYKIEWYQTMKPAHAINANSSSHNTSPGINDSSMMEISSNAEGVVHPSSLRLPIPSNMHETNEDMSNIYIGPIHLQL